MNPRPDRIIVARVTLAVLTMACAGADAADYTWDPSILSGSLNDPANWTPSGGPPGANDTGVFNHPHTEYDAHTVTLPQATTIGGLRVVGDDVLLELPAGPLTLSGTSSSAFSVESSADLPSHVYIRRGSVLIPNGGLQLLDTRPQRTATPNFRIEPGVSLSVDRVSILDGTLVATTLLNSASVITIARDLDIGDPSTPASERRFAPQAEFVSLGATTIGGSVRVHPDGILRTNHQFGTTAIAGTLLSTGKVAGSGRLAPDFTNGGEFIPGFVGTTFIAPMTLDGAYTQTADGVLNVSVRRSAAAPLIINDPSVQVAGNVLVTPLDFGSARVGDRYLLVDTDATIQYSATMASPYSGFTFQPLLVPGEGLYAVVTAVGVPEPSSSALLAGAGALLYARPRRK